MQPKTYCFQNIGRSNQYMGMGIQDAVFQKTENGIKASVLADGAGNSPLASIGSKAVSKELCEYMVDEVYGFIEASEELVRYNVALVIDRILDELTVNFERSRDAFSSTIVGAVFDLRRNMFCTVHIGDGMILIDSHNRYVPLSYPKNGLSRNKTFLTTSDRIMEKMQIYRGRLEGINEMVLISDGVYKPPGSEELLETKLRSIRAGAGELLQVDDDQSIVFMDKIS